MLRVWAASSLSRTGKLWMSLAAFVLLAWFAYPTAAEQPPNLIFILVDDQGYYDLGSYGATEFATPNIDQLATDGVRFTNYYAAALCIPKTDPRLFSGIKLLFVRSDDVVRRGEQRRQHCLVGVEAAKNQL